MTKEQKPLPPLLERAEIIFNLFKKVVLFVKKYPKEIVMTLLIFVALLMLHFGFVYFQTQLAYMRKMIEDNNSKLEVPQNIVVSNTVDNQRINAVLRELLTGSGSDRAYVFQFHNGRKGLSGIEFLYFTNTHEQVMPGVSSEISSLQSLPISLGTEIFADLIKNKKPTCWKVADLKDMGLKDSLARQAITDLCFEAMHDEAGNLIGFIGIDYVTRKIPTTADAKNELYALLALQNARIEELLGPKSEVNLSKNPVK